MSAYAWVVIFYQFDFLSKLESFWQKVVNHWSSKQKEICFDNNSPVSRVLIEDTANDWWDNQHPDSGKYDALINEAEDIEIDGFWEDSVVVIHDEDKESDR